MELIMFATTTAPPTVLAEGLDYDLGKGALARRYSYGEIAAMSEAGRNAIGVATVQAATPRLARQVLVSERVEIVGGKPAIVTDLKTMELHDRKQQLLADLANIRWSREVDGIAFGMVRVGTDDRAKLMISAARAKAKEDPNYAVRWKVAPGAFKTLSAPQLIALGDAVEAHVSACFAHEEVLSKAINAAADHDALDGIDLDAGWPE